MSSKKLLVVVLSVTMLYPGVKASNSGKVADGLFKSGVGGLAFIVGAIYGIKCGTTIFGQIKRQENFGFFGNLWNKAQDGVGTSSSGLTAVEGCLVSFFAFWAGACLCDAGIQNLKDAFAADTKPVVSPAPTIYIIRKDDEKVPSEDLKKVANLKTVVEKDKK